MDIRIEIPNSEQSAHSRALELAQEVALDNQEFAKRNEIFSKFLWKLYSGDLTSHATLLLSKHVINHGSNVCACKSIPSNVRMYCHESFFFCDLCKIDRTIDGIRETLQLQKRK